MDYISLDTIPHYTECSPLVAGLGYVLVELRVIPQHGVIRVLAVISHPAGENSIALIGINDCAKVHRALLPRLEVVLNSQDIYMEVTSPGMERVIKNAAEFALFTGHLVRVWDSDVTDWIAGKIVVSDTESVTLEMIRTELVKGAEPSIGAPESKRIPYGRIAKAKLLQM